MRKLLLIFALLYSFAICVAKEIAPCNDAEETVETVSPSYNTEIQRRVSYIDIEGTTYFNVVVTLKSNKPDYYFVTKGNVKVTITDSEGKIIYNKKLKDSFLYLFANGQIQVGQKNFNKIIIFKSDYTDTYTCKIREKEGVY